MMGPDFKTTLVERLCKMSYPVGLHGDDDFTVNKYNFARIIVEVKLCDKHMDYTLTSIACFVLKYIRDGTCLSLAVCVEIILFLCLYCTVFD